MFLLILQTFRNQIDSKAEKLSICWLFVIDDISGNDRSLSVTILYRFSIFPSRISIFADCLNMFLSVIRLFRCTNLIAFQSTVRQKLHPYYSRIMHTIPRQEDVGEAYYLEQNYSVRNVECITDSNNYYSTQQEVKFCLLMHGTNDYISEE